MRVAFEEGLRVTGNIQWPADDDFLVVVTQVQVCYHSVTSHYGALIIHY